MTANWGDEDYLDPMHPDAGGPGMEFASDDFDAPPTPPCAACGGAFRYLNRLNLCDACNSAWEAEMDEWERMERLDDDLAATRSYYSGV
jgi:hypothetical protein